MKGKATERNPKVIESCVTGENSWEGKMKEGRNQLYGKFYIGSLPLLQRKLEGTDLGIGY